MTRLCPAFLEKKTKEARLNKPADEGTKGFKRGKMETDSTKDYTK